MAIFRGPWRSSPRSTSEISFTYSPVYLCSLYRYAVLTLSSICSGFRYFCDDSSDYGAQSGPHVNPVSLCSLSVVVSLIANKATPMCISPMPACLAQRGPWVSRAERRPSAARLQGLERPASLRELIPSTTPAPFSKREPTISTDIRLYKTRTAENRLWLPDLLADYAVIGFGERSWVQPPPVSRPS